MKHACSLLVLAAACSTESASLSVALQRFDHTNNCWENVGLESSPDAGSLGLPAFCSTTAGRNLKGGTDRLRIVISYDDLEVTNGATITLPTIVTRVDGLVQEVPFEFEQRRDDGKLIVLGNFDAPARSAAELNLTITAAADLQASIPAVSAERLSLVAPQLVVAHSGDADLEGGVGETSVDVRVASRVGGDAVLSWTLGGVPQPETLTLPLVRVGDEVIGRKFVPVPGSAKKWQITARFAGLEGKSPEIQLAEPNLTAELIACDSPCKVKAGSTRALRVVAPRGIQTPKASISTYVNGAPRLVDVLFDLGVEDVGNDTIEGTKELVVPDDPTAEWKIDVRVSGFRAPSATAKIEP